MKIENDYLHSLFAGVMSSTLLRQRDVFQGNWTGDKCVCLSFDCDYKDDMMACAPIIDLLVAEGISASFAIPGHLVKEFPTIINNILEHDQEILNHTLSHPPNFRNLSIDVIRPEIEDFQELMAKTYNYLPKGFRCPHGLRKTNYSLFDVLKANKMYDSSLLGYTTTNVAGVLEIPLTPCPEHPLMAFDSYHHFRFPLISASEKKMLRLWGMLLDKHSLINIFLDPIDFCTKSRLELLDHMIKKAIQLDFTFMRMDNLFSLFSTKSLIDIASKKL
jgi:peptidoglycan/xylan/chitin deacetylase (PgdA/CDA1 family)